MYNVSSKACLFLFLITGLQLQSCGAPDGKGLVLIKVVISGGQVYMQITDPLVGDMVLFLGSECANTGCDKLPRKVCAKNGIRPYCSDACNTEHCEAK